MFVKKSVSKCLTKTEECKTFNTWNWMQTITSDSLRGNYIYFLPQVNVIIEKIACSRETVIYTMRTYLKKNWFNDHVALQRGEQADLVSGIVSVR